MEKRYEIRWTNKVGSFCFFTHYRTNSLMGAQAVKALFERDSKTANQIWIWDTLTGEGIC